MLSDPQAKPGASLSGYPRRFRLVDRDGAPHPVLDDLYDSLESAWEEARAWWEGQGSRPEAPMPIGIEVSTGCGSWRTLRHPGSQTAGPV